MYGAGSGRFDVLDKSNGLADTTAAAASMATTSSAAAASLHSVSAVDSEVENYHRILDSIGTPNYTHIRALFSDNGNLPSNTIPAIQVSFEMFEAVQARFSATKSTLERTKEDLLTRNQQYTTLQGSMQTLQSEHAVVKKRAIEAESQCMTHQQTIAKQEMKMEQMRSDMKEARAELEAVHAKFRNCMDELQEAQNRVTEGMVTLSMKDAVITTLRRELGKSGRFGRSGIRSGKEGDDGESGAKEQSASAAGYTTETLQSIAAEVEACSQEARLKLTITDLETNLKRTENESVLILRQHDNYMLHVENVIQNYEEQCMQLQDAVSAHRCVRTPFFLSSRYYRELAEISPQMLLLMFPCDRDKNSTKYHSKKRVKSGNSERAVATTPSVTFAQLAAESQQWRADLARSSSAVACRDAKLYSALTQCGEAHVHTFGIGAELLGFLATLEDALTRRKLNTTELREEWTQARVGYFVEKVAGEMKQSARELRQSLEKIAQHVCCGVKQNDNESNNIDSITSSKDSWRGRSRRERSRSAALANRPTRSHARQKSVTDSRTHAPTDYAAKDGNRSSVHSSSSNIVQADEAAGTSLEHETAMGAVGRVLHTDSTIRSHSFASSIWQTPSRGQSPSLSSSRSHSRLSSAASAAARVNRPEDTPFTDVEQYPLPMMHAANEDVMSSVPSVHSSSNVGQSDSPHSIRGSDMEQSGEGGTVCTDKETKAQEYDSGYTADTLLRPRVLSQTGLRAPTDTSKVVQSPECGTKLKSLANKAKNGSTTGRRASSARGRKGETEKTATRSRKAFTQQLRNNSRSSTASRMGSGNTTRARESVVGKPSRRSTVRVPTTSTAVSAVQDGALHARSKHTSSRSIDERAADLLTRTQFSVPGVMTVSSSSSLLDSAPQSTPAPAKASESRDETCAGVEHTHEMTNDQQQQAAAAAAAYAEESEKHTRGEDDEATQHASASTTSMSKNVTGNVHTPASTTKALPHSRLSSPASRKRSESADVSTTRQEHRRKNDDNSGDDGDSQEGADATLLRGNRSNRRHVPIESSLLARSVAPSHRVTMGRMSRHERREAVELAGRMLPPVVHARQNEEEQTKSHGNEEESHNTLSYERPTHAVLVQGEGGGITGKAIRVAPLRNASTGLNKKSYTDIRTVNNMRYRMDVGDDAGRVASQNCVGNSARAAHNRAAWDPRGGASGVTGVCLRISPQRKLLEQQTSSNNANKFAFASINTDSVKKTMVSPRPTSSHRQYHGQHQHHFHISPLTTSRLRQGAGSATATSPRSHLPLHSPLGEEPLPMPRCDEAREGKDYLRRGVRGVGYLTGSRETSLLAADARSSHATDENYPTSTDTDVLRVQHKEEEQPQWRKEYDCKSVSQCIASQQPRLHMHQQHPLILPRITFPCTSIPWTYSDAAHHGSAHVAHASPHPMPASASLSSSEARSGVSGMFMLGSANALSDCTPERNARHVDVLSSFASRAGTNSLTSTWSWLPPRVLSVGGSRVTSYPNRARYRDVAYAIVTRLLRDNNNVYLAANRMGSGRSVHACDNHSTESNPSATMGDTNKNEPQQHEQDEDRVGGTHVVHNSFMSPFRSCTLPYRSARPGGPTVAANDNASVLTHMVAAVQSQRERMRRGVCDWVISGQRIGYSGGSRGAHISHGGVAPSRWLPEWRRRQRLRQRLRQWQYSDPHCAYNHPHTHDANDNYHRYRSGSIPSESIDRKMSRSPGHTTVADDAMRSPTQDSGVRRSESWAALRRRSNRCAARREDSMLDIKYAARRLSRSL